MLAASGATAPGAIIDTAQGGIVALAQMGTWPRLVGVVDHVRRDDVGGFVVVVEAGGRTG